MLKGNRCELCNEKVETNKARHKQTKYCRRCAKQKKKENSEESWLPEDRKDYMRVYMQNYRRLHPNLNTSYMQKHRERRRKTALPDGNGQNSNYLCLIPLLFIAPVSSETISQWFDVLKTLINHLELSLLDITGLIFAGMFCWHHLQKLIKKNDKEDKS